MSQIVTKPWCRKQVKAGYILRRPETPQPEAGADEAGLAVDEEARPGTVRCRLPCVACGEDLRGRPLGGRCAECGGAVADSVLVLPNPDTARLAIRLIPWAVLFWVFTIITGPFSGIAAALAAVCAYLLRARCGFDKLPGLADGIRRLWLAAAIGAAVTLAFALVDSPWYFTTFQSLSLGADDRAASFGRICHALGSFAVYIVALIVTWHYVAVCRRLARQARRETLATGFTVVLWLYLLSLLTAVGMATCRMGIGRYDSYSWGGGLLQYVTGAPGGMWALCVLAATVWLIVIAYRLSVALQDVPRDLAELVEPGDYEPPPGGQDGPPAGGAAGMLVADERGCVNCGYMLRSVRVTDRCPECGSPVADSLAAPARPRETGQTLHV